MPIFEENGPDNFKGVDIMRAVRSFDPCLPCGVHMYLGGGRTLKKMHSPMFGAPPWLSSRTPRLDDAAVEPRLARLDERARAAGADPRADGRAGAGSGRRRWPRCTARRWRGAGRWPPRAAPRLVADELLGHLLVLHGIHPDPVERRVGRALDDDAPAVRERGGEVALVGVLDDGVARVRLTSCGVRRGGREDEVRDAVLAVAPELPEVDGRRRRPLRRSSRSASLMQRPAGVGP